ncbi:Lar family restriction alleviation protein [Enterococcus faecalis]|uniref:Lar family restriction alleviation protein n=1 Tax=Enterococcus faecalis TaxID=1351 RepID=UPI000FF89F28|nr:Lar family restriction alleviation protein [Enterococcus faecalis]RXA17765.1 restriction endonuclease [Enterococcus faecalis]RXA87473.1 restriction endonuclease [Enterococcus faecalis]RXA88583.1 restriction endonuclease [Enterococcus faecalis]
MSGIHIKPCPFCGSENISFNAFSILSDAYVLCEQCNASIEISVPWDDMDEKEHDKVCFEKLSILWNNRVSESNQPELNENQQIVLKHLKSMCPPKLGLSAMVTVYRLVDDNINDNWQEYSEEIPEHIEALQKLSVAEEFQVLTAFAQWGLEQEEE